MKKKYLKCASIILISILFLALGICLFCKSYSNSERDVIQYTEKGNVNYNVYLNENNFFDQPFLGPGQAYITTLINYLDINFKYDFDTLDNRSGSYTYYIKAEISANTTSGGENSFWKKSYNLTEPKTIDYSNTNKISILENIKVDYQYYNDIMLNFKKEYGLALNGNLKIILYVENNIKSDIVEHDISKAASLYFNIPLTKATIEVPADVSNIENNDTIFS